MSNQSITGVKSIKKRKALRYEKLLSDITARQKRLRFFVYLEVKENIVNTTPHFT
jgi:hypothetical protein